jgi:hypothetical protein
VGNSPCISTISSSAISITVTPADPKLFRVQKEAIWLQRLLQCCSLSVEYSLTVYWPSAGA